MTTEFEPYILYSSPRPIDEFGGWAGNVGVYDHVVGFSRLGHAFLFALSASEYAVLHPFRAAYKQYGRFNALSYFEQHILHDEGFAEYVLQPPHLAEISRHAGVLSDDEVYIPCPYPHLGGDEAPHSYQKGKFREFMMLVASSHGFE